MTAIVVCVGIYLAIALVDADLAARADGCLMPTKEPPLLGEGEVARG